MLKNIVNVNRIFLFYVAIQESTEIEISIYIGSIEDTAGDRWGRHCKEERGATCLLNARMIENIK